LWVGFGTGLGCCGGAFARLFAPCPFCPAHRPRRPSRTVRSLTWCFDRPPLQWAFLGCQRCQEACRLAVRDTALLRHASLLAAFRRWVEISASRIVARGALQIATTITEREARGQTLRRWAKLAQEQATETRYRLQGVLCYHRGGVARALIGLREAVSQGARHFSLVDRARRLLLHLLIAKGWSWWSQRSHETTSLARGVWVLVVFCVLAIFTLLF
jgi:hypothetical protein